MQKEAEFSPMRLKGSKSIVDLIKAKERLDAKLLDKNRHNMAVGYRDNYIEGLKKQLGPLAGPIIELLEGLTPEQVAAALEKDFIYSIDFQYSYMDALIKAETLFDAWFSYRRELDPENYTEEEQAEAFIAAYEDVEGEGWEDITERSNVVNLGRVHDPKWTDLAPDEIAALFEEKRAKGEQMKAARKRNKKGRRK